MALGGRRPAGSGAARRNLSLQGEDTMAVRIEKVFDSPGPHPNGMQATPDGLWILDQHTNQLSLVSYGGEVLKTLDTASDRGSGITDAGAALWIASTYSREILKVDRDDGTTVAAFAT